MAANLSGNIEVTLTIVDNIFLKKGIAVRVFQDATEYVKRPTGLGGDMRADSETE